MKNAGLVGSSNTAVFADTLFVTFGGLIVLVFNDDGGGGVRGEAVVSWRRVSRAAWRVGGGADERGGVLGLERIDGEVEDVDDPAVAGRFGFTALGVGGGCRREFERYISVGELVSIRVSSGQNMDIDGRLAAS